MAVGTIMVKNKPYDGMRLSIVGSQSGDQYIYYTEAIGDRHYTNEIGSAEQSLESVSFDAYLSFTSSGTQSWYFNLIPMGIAETVIIETRALALKEDGSGGFICQSYGGYKHSGATLSVIGGSFDYSIKTDMNTASMSYSTYGTSSIVLNIYGESGAILDWDVYIKYTKGYHTLLIGTTSTVNNSGNANRQPYTPPPIPID